jgi:alpha-galactosidase
MPADPVYGMNNWYYAYGNSSHDMVLRDAGMVSQLSSNSSNRPFMVMDDGWQHSHQPNFNGGPWHTGNAGFPDMPGLAEGIVRQGARPGLWVRPLYTAEGVPQSWCFPVDRHRGFLSHLVLDPSVPESLEHIAQDIRRLAQWGYQLIKHDYTTWDIFGQWGFQMNGRMGSDGWGFRDQSRTTAEIIVDLYRTIRDAAGDAIIIGCNTIGHLAAGLVEIQRTGDDTSGREWERTRKMGINTLAMRMPQHGAFYACDADCVGLTEFVPWRLNRQWLDLLANSGTPLFVSPDPLCLDAERKVAMREAFDLASRPIPIAHPLDWMDTTCPQTWRFGQQVRRFDWNQTHSDTAG